MTAGAGVVAAGVEGVTLLLVAVVVATALGLWLRRSGHALGSRRRGDERAAEGAPTLRSADLGADLGERATLVHFSSAFCQPCRATRRVLDDVAAMVPGVVAVEVDAEASLDLVRRLGVRRTPTVLVLDRDGRIVRRASGQPRKADVIAALGFAVSP